MLLQNASGALDEPEHVVGSLPSAEFLCVGNFDGDGRQDIAAMGNGQLNLYLQKPGGGLNEPVQTPLAGLVWDCKVSDVNGDGRDDLVILPYSVRETIVLIALQKETGGFEDIRTLTWEGIQGRWDAIQAATAIAVGDFNGDGRVDFALGPRLNLLFQLEDGSFAPVLLQIGEGLVIPAPGIGHNDARAIEAADVNGDGLLDLIAATASNTGSTSLPSYLLPGSAVEVHAQLAEGGFAAAATYSLPSYQDGFAVSDVNGDDVPDILSTASVLLSRNIVSARNAGGFRGQSLNYQMITRRPATRFAASGLPSDLVLDPVTGVISGRPHKSGTFEITLQAWTGDTVSTDSLTLDIRVPHYIQGGYVAVLEDDGKLGSWTKAFVAFFVTRRGQFTGQLHLNGVKIPLRGRFDNGEFEATLPSTPLGPASLHLQIPSPDDVIAFHLISPHTLFRLSHARLSSGRWNLRGLPVLSYPFAETRPAEAPGRYTVLLGLPRLDEGYGFGTMNVSEEGNVRTILRLINGRVASIGSSIIPGGTEFFPYCMLAANRDLSGTIAFGDNPRSDCHGQISWLGPRVAGASGRERFFGQPLIFSASRYVMKSPILHFSGKAEAIILSWHKSVGKEDDGVFFSDRSKFPGVLSADNTFTFRDRLGFVPTLHLDPTSGFLSGTLDNTRNGNSIPLSGVIFQKTNSGAGFCSGRAHSELFDIQPVVRRSPSGGGVVVTLPGGDFPPLIDP
ncbi:MAG TPA: VCBS repeat-containing protein [Chthoniobacteraceae bacterium]|nr:VCBS repeat-containing protein [Chthoniobacteraceae bacterium]